MSLTYTVANQGTATAGSSKTKFYLSTDDLLDGEDTYLGYDSVSSLGAGLTRNETANLLLSKTLTSGTYHLIAQADGESLIAEGDEENNSFSQIVKITKPDLVINSLSTPASVATGTSVSFNYTISNLGTAIASSSKTKYYLSSNTTFDASDVYLGDDPVASLAVGASNTEAEQLLPLTLA